MNIEKMINLIVEDLQANATSFDIYAYEVKATHQIIRKHITEQLELYGVGNSKRETLDNFSELLQKVVKKTKASDTGLIYVDAGDIMQDVCDNYMVIKK